MKSLLLSLLLSAFVSYIFINLIDQNSQTWVSKLPNWTAVLFIIIIGIGYLLAMYWGVKGIINGQRLANGFGILLSLLGIGLYWAFISMELKHDKAKEGQFDYVILTENRAEIEKIQAILDQANLHESDIKMLTYWDLLKSEDTIAICMQKGKIIGLSIKNVALNDVSCLSSLTGLSSLTLKNCGLTAIKNLNLLRAERLNLNDNSLKNLSGINAPKVMWLDVKNNQLSSLEGIEKLPKAQYVNFDGNRITDFLAAKNHPFLNYLTNKK